MKNIMKRIKDYFTNSINDKLDEKIGIDGLLDEAKEELLENKERTEEQLVSIKRSYLETKDELLRYKKSLNEVNRKIKDALDNGREEEAEVLATEYEDLKEIVESFEENLSAIESKYKEALVVAKENAKNIKLRIAELERSVSKTKVYQIINSNKNIVNNLEASLNNSTMNNSRALKKLNKLAKKYEAAVEVDRDMNGAHCTSNYTDTRKTALENWKNENALKD